MVGRTLLHPNCERDSAFTRGPGVILAKGVESSEGGQKHVRPLGQQAPKKSEQLRRGGKPATDSGSLMNFLQLSTFELASKKLGVQWQAHLVRNQNVEHQLYEIDSSVIK